jgi:hypothetical protein
VADEPKTYTQAEVEAMIAEQVSGLKANRDELAKEAKQAKAKLAAYDGVDPEEHKRLKTAAEEAERKKAEAQGDFKALEKQLIDRHTAELSARDGKLGKMTKALEQRLIQAELTQALVNAGVSKGMIDLLVLKGASHGRIRETDDGFEGYVADEKGNPLVADGKGSPMTWDAFVEQNLKTKYPDAFAGSGSSGGGAPKSTGGAGGAGNVIAAGDNAAFIANLSKMRASFALSMTKVNVWKA